jgi:hypothetical protein
MAPQMSIGSFVGKQPQTVSDPLSPVHETCWIWKPTDATEFWVLYRGPFPDHPFVEPSPVQRNVWLEIEYLDGAEFFPDVGAFIAWVLDRLLAQGRRNLPADIELRTHTIT